MQPTITVQLLFVILLAGPVLAQDLGPAFEAEKEFFISQVRSSPADKRLEVVERTLKTFKAQNTPEEVASLTDAVFLALRLDGAGLTREVARMEQALFLAALEQPDKVSVLRELILVLRLRIDRPSRPDGSDQEARRKIDLMFDTWRRMESAIDPSFDPGHFPFGNVLAPNGVVGADPEQIPDAVAREKYLRAIEANRKEAEHYRVQYDLRRLKPQLLRELETSIPLALRAKAVSEGSVLYDLSTISDGDAKARIREAMKMR